MWKTGENSQRKWRNKQDKGKMESKKVPWPNEEGPNVEWPNVERPNVDWPRVELQKVEWRSMTECRMIEGRKLLKIEWPKVENYRK